MRRVAPLALALALASCTSGTAKPTASGAPTPSATNATAAPSGRSLVLAVTREGRPGIDLYRVDADRRAHLLRRLEPPASNDELRGVALSEATDPRVCTMWSPDEREGDGSGWEVLTCDGFPAPVEPPQHSDLGELAMDPSGQRLFWGVSSSSDAESVTVADLTDHGVTNYRSYALECERYLLGAAWVGEDRLVVHCTSGDNDDPGELSTFELGRGTHQIGDEEQFGTPAPWDGSSVLALERVCDARCQEALKTTDAVGRKARVVRVDLRTGRVVEVVATAAAGRFVDLVTGGAHGVVYGTRPEAGYRPLKAYLRWPGEKHGVPITGLPADVATVVAQP